MHPIERLRWIARAEGEPPSLVATEAAFTLAELAAYEPAAVLTAARRLVERHPACGPLWWASARVAGSDEPAAAADAVAAALLSDPTPQRIAEALRDEVARSDLVCATVPAELLREALSHRGGYELRLVAPYLELRHELGAFGTVTAEVTGYEPEEAAEALSGAAVLLVEPLLAGPPGVLVSSETAATVATAAEEGVPVWVLLGAGRVLGSKAVETAAGLVGDGYELLEAGRFTLAVDMSGPVDAGVALSRTTSPPGIELVPRRGR